HVNLNSSELFGLCLADRWIGIRLVEDEFKMLENMRFIRFGLFFSLMFAAMVVLDLPAHCQAQATWQIEVVDSGFGKEAGAFSSLVIDRFGSFHLAYSNRGGTVLRYAFRAKAEKPWDKATIDSTGGSFAALAVDPHGWAHIAYNSSQIPGLHYAQWDG